jgi:hypothetical protein
MTGYAYVFLRPDGAALPAGDAGHVGWGFQLESGGYYAGSTENEAGHPVVPPGGDNGWWAEHFATAEEMAAAMKLRNYLCYKVAEVANCNPETATVVANGCKGCGYDGVGNNCLDHVARVLHAYDEPGLPWDFFHPTPNNWFSDYNGEFHNL